MIVASCVTYANNKELRNRLLGFEVLHTEICYTVIQIDTRTGV